jgi:nicotinate-nucleotide pyrophosphorylase
MNRNLEEELILLAIQEDAGPGDHTSLACIPHAEKDKARLITKENGILAGIRVAKLVFGMIDPELQINILLHDGSRVTKGDIAFIVEGNSRSILQSERLVLNFLQRMSGIATITDKYVQHLKEFRTRVMDTVNYGGINRIMLDNFDIQQTHEAIQIINKKFETESSGGITLDNIRDYAMCGVDFVSIGALTHHIQSLDMSLKAL